MCSRRKLEHVKIEYDHIKERVGAGRVVGEGGSQYSKSASCKGVQIRNGVR